MSKEISPEPSLIEDNNTNNHAAKEKPKSNSKNETAAMRQLSHQINNLTGTNEGIERQLLSIKNDIKQLTKTVDDDDRKSIKQIQSQITQLETHVSKIEKDIGNVFESIKSNKKNKGGKWKKNKRKKNKKGKK